MPPGHAPIEEDKQYLTTCSSLWNSPGSTFFFLGRRLSRPVVMTQSTLPLTRIDQSFAPMFVPTFIPKFVTYTLFLHAMRPHNHQASTTKYHLVLSPLHLKVQWFTMASAVQVATRFFIIALCTISHLTFTLAQAPAPAPAPSESASEPSIGLYQVKFYFFNQNDDLFQSRSKCGNVSSKTNLAYPPSSLFAGSWNPHVPRLRFLPAYRYIHLSLRPKLHTILVPSPLDLPGTD